MRQVTKYIIILASYQSPKKAWIDQQRSVVQSVICSVVEKHGGEIYFLTLSSELVETKSKPHFSGTVLKSRSRKDIDKSSSIAPSAKPKEQSFFLKLVCRRILSIIWRRRRWFFIVIFYFIFILEKRGKFPYVSLFVGNMSGCLFKRIKLLSTIREFLSHSSFLSKFFGRRNESYRTCNVRNRKVDPSN